MPPIGSACSYPVVTYQPKGAVPAVCLIGVISDIGITEVCQDADLVLLVPIKD